MFNLKQNEAFCLIKKGHNVYIGGQAGTGKTFLLQECVKYLRGEGKIVYLTCTTGIACTNYPSSIGAETIHRWSGIGDGRLTCKEICNFITTNGNMKITYEKIKSGDVLIVDEVSMFSRRLFETLESICSLKDPSRLFGGMQVIFGGDFFQLPPVRNILYDDDGSYCFESDLFDMVFSHRVFLNDIVRQSQHELINAITELSGARKQISDDTISLMDQLSRPLAEDGMSSLKLFATNQMADAYNRDQILRMEGDLFEYVAQDAGEKKYISTILAPQRLWLKKNCPVVLIRNISDTLVNGSQGKVVNCEEDGVTMFFHEMKLTATIPKMSFTVYSPRKKVNLAERIQFPLKLGFALTIHKSQGMTLDRVEIDCRQISQPGQLAVALGRVRTLSGLRVINFNKDAFIPQPEKIHIFCNQSSVPEEEDLTCCHRARTKIYEYLANIETEDTGTQDDLFQFETITEKDDFQEQEQTLDDDFNQIIANLPLEEDDTDVTMIPEEFDIRHCIHRLMNGNVQTPMQKETNDLASHLLKDENFKRVQIFIGKQFQVIMKLTEDLQMNKDAINAVKPELVSEFYKKCHVYQTSDEYKLSCFLLAADKPVHSQAALYHVCFNLTVDVRKYLLKEKEKLFPISSRKISERQCYPTVTGSARSKVRYVGGYCLAKLRFKYNGIQQSNCFNTSEQGQSCYAEAKCKMTILDGLKQMEHHLKESTDDPESLTETERKQCLTRGLTNISDDLFKFFMELCSQCLKLLIDKNINMYGSNLHKFCISEILGSGALYDLWSGMICKRCFEEISPSNSVEDLVYDLSLKASCIKELFEEIIQKFLAVMLNQFRKDFLQAMSVEKKMAHRKQIRISKQTCTKLSPISYKNITEDKSKDKVVSHHLLKSGILEDKLFLMSFKKEELKDVCKAYGIKCCAADGKKKMSEKLIEGITQSEKMKNPEFIRRPTSVEKQHVQENISEHIVHGTHKSDDTDTENKVTEPQVKKQASLRDECKETVSSITEPVAGTSYIRREGQEEKEKEFSTILYESDKEDDNEYDEREFEEKNDEICKLCQKEYVEGEFWIQCDDCSGWYHRNCAGLSNIKRWHKFSKTGIKFTCLGCQ